MGSTFQQSGPLTPQPQDHILSSFCSSGIRPVNNPSNHSKPVKAVSLIRLSGPLTNLCFVSLWRKVTWSPQIHPVSCCLSVSGCRFTSLSLSLFVGIGFTDSLLKPAEQVCYSRGIPRNGARAIRMFGHCSVFPTQLAQSV